MQELKLNQGQELAASGFFDFLFSDKKEFIIAGWAGTGKTFLMGQLIDKIIPQYQETCKLMGIPCIYKDVIMTATTNKAAEELGVATQRPTQTIHSFLNLKVTEDYSTGQSKLTKTKGWTIHEYCIIFIDECSMIDYPLRELILEGTNKCKIVYVGDHRQLAPIKEPISPIYRDKLPFFELSQPMRNADQPVLMDICNQFRATVDTNVFKPIQVVPGIIDHLSMEQMEKEIENHFLDQSLKYRILAYTNNRVIAYNDHIRELRQLHDEFTLGELLVNNSAIRFPNGMLSVEEEVEIIDQDPMIQKEMIEPDVFLEVRFSTLKARNGQVFSDAPIPVDRNHFTALVNYYRRRKDWYNYYHLKNTYPELRQRDSSTVHKAQGSTYDTVFIDMQDLSTCRQENLAARLLYVAFSRAKTRVIMYGDLAEKYGGIIR